jgi:DNA-binding NtrC family response regulator
MKSVLLIEDNGITINKWRKDLRRFEADFIIAQSLSEAEDAIASKEFDIYVFDGCMNHHDQYDTKHLIQEISQKFQGAIRIAASKSPDLRKEMIKDGCTHECDKTSVPRLIRRILKP